MQDIIIYMDNIIVFKFDMAHKYLIFKVKV